jgi:hypothetical protein
MREISLEDEVLHYGEPPSSCDDCGKDSEGLFVWHCNDFEIDDDFYFCAGCYLKHAEVRGTA